MVITTFSQISLLLDVTASRKHAIVHFHDDAYYLMDLGAFNGSQINQVTVPSWVGVRLSAGDDIRIGSTGFTVLDMDERCHFATYPFFCECAAATARGFL